MMQFYILTEPIESSLKPTEDLLAKKGQSVNIASYIDYSNYFLL